MEMIPLAIVSRYVVPDAIMRVASCDSESVCAVLQHIFNAGINTV